MYVYEHLLSSAQLQTSVLLCLYQLHNSIIQNLTMAGDKGTKSILKIVNRIKKWMENYF
jgi:hypothetical protein